MSSHYQLLDCGNFSKLEKIGPYTFVRPSPQAVWSPSLEKSVWDAIDARYFRKSDGDGYWKNMNQKLPEQWEISIADIKVFLKQTSFGHIGAFLEQAENWTQFRSLILSERARRSQYRVLNLFAYTGLASIACAQAGADVVHLDASKGSNNWAKENAKLNNIEDHLIRWITDDAIDFVSREVRRGHKYEAIILDPPSYGRGAKKKVWKIERDMVPLLNQLRQLMSEEFHFISLSSHSQGYTPVALKNLLSEVCFELNGSYTHNEMLIPYAGGALPAGATCMFSSS